MPEYQFHARQSARNVIITLHDDLSARKAAEMTTDIVRVEREGGCVVWRRAETEDKENE